MRASRKFPPRPWLLVAGLAGALHAQQAPRTEVVTAALAAGHAATQARIAAAPQLELADGGVCGLLGGATVKLGSGAATVLQVPLPQELAGQVPLAFTCVVEPANVWRGAALVREPGQSVALQVTLQAPRSLGMLFGRGPEVKIAWSGVVLLAERPEPVVADAVADYLAATPCAPAEHADLVASSKAIAPPETSPAELAVRLQAWIASRRPLVRPRTLDALSLLSAGNHGICTVNANFAAAVLRQRGVPAQLLAVVPTNGMRLEMHRIVAWHEGGRWQRFDPSGVHADVPMRTSQSVVVACTSIADERGGALLFFGLLPRRALVERRRADRLSVGTGTGGRARRGRALRLGVLLDAGQAVARLRRRRSATRRGAGGVAAVPGDGLAAGSRHAGGGGDDPGPVRGGMGRAPRTGPPAAVTRAGG